MKEKTRNGLLLLALALVSSAHAKGPRPERLDKIWDAAMTRITTQHDVWFEGGDFPAAIQLLKFESELKPGDYEVWTNLGWMEENVQSWDGALATYLRYRRENPKDPDNALPLADFYSRKKMFAKVVETLEPVIKLPCHPNNFRLLARAYERQGMLGDSARVWSTYLTRSPSDGAAKANLARVESKLKKGT